MALKTTLRRQLWRSGWDLHRFTPDYGLDAFLTYFLADRNINLVIDVGARVGEFGQFLRSLGYRERIASFEPLPEHLQQLRAVARADGNWSVYPYALGSTAGEATIAVGRETDMSSMLPARADAPTLFPGITADTSVTVEVRRLDDLFTEVTAGIANPSVYLKIDTQGFDLEVIRGAKASLERIAALQTEVSFIPLYQGQPTCAEVVTELAASRFVPAGFYAVSRVPEGCFIEADGVFLRR